MSSGDEACRRYRFVYNSGIVHADDLYTVNMTINGDYKWYVYVTYY